MNGFVFSTGRWIVIGACAISWLGCKQETAKHSPPEKPVASDGQSTPRFHAGPNAKTILQELIARYATATSYQDKAVLYLSYKLEGRNIQEPQRWATTWTKSGKLSAQLFNGSIQGDGSLLSCYIYDIATANLDNQHLLIPYDVQLPLSQLFRDSIAKHFLGGYSELPLDETDLVSPPRLIPATLSLLTNQVRNGWIQEPTRIERLADSSIDGNSCYVIRCLWNGMTSDVWIDTQSYTLVQMSLPLKLLAGEVITSPEITDVVLLAKFHEAEFNGTVPENAFVIQQRPDATPVRKFVALPETFPSELIGQIAPNFQLVSQTGKPADRKDFADRITTLLWLAGKPSYPAIAKLDSLAASLNPDKFHFGTVYSDSDLKSPGTASLEVVDQLASVIDVTNSSVYYDSQLAASTALRVKVIPSIIVLDGNAKIQYTKAVTNKNWVNEVKAAVERIAAGEDVAAEMQVEYERFLGSYQQQLLTVSASDLIEPRKAGVSSQAPSAVNQVAGTRSQIQLRPVKSWGNTEFEQAGNLAVLNIEEPDGDGSNETAYLVFDGWQTVVELDVQGKTRNRVELNLPDQTAVNRIRVGTDANRQRMFAVFSTLGKRVFLFDQAWKPMGVYPNGDVAEVAGIQDCQLTDLNSDGVSELIVALDDNSGVQLVDPNSMEGKRISGSVATSIVEHGDDLVVAGDGKLGMLKTGLTNAVETELDFRRVASLSPSHLCGIGVTRGGQWNAVGFDPRLERIWTLSVGSQFFESEIEPVAVVQTPTGEVIWAIADTENSIHLVSGSGKWLGDFQSESQLGGLSLASVGGQTNLLVSNKDGLECWDLNFSLAPAKTATGPVSQARKTGAAPVSQK